MRVWDWFPLNHHNIDTSRERKDSWTGVRVGIGRRQERREILGGRREEEKKKSTRVSFFPFFP